VRRIEVAKASLIGMVEEMDEKQRARLLDKMRGLGQAGK